MSETDDTEDLLLIPPDFFLVQSEPEPPYYFIVDSLIKQVSNLQDRIEGIESMSDVSLNSFPNQNQENKNMLGTASKKYFSHNDLYQPLSTESTPQKQHQMHSLPNTPLANRFSPKKNGLKSSSATKETTPNETFREIDCFISNVRTLQRNQAARNLGRAFDKMENTKGDAQKSANRKDVQKTMDHLNRQSEKINKVNAWKCGDNADGIPDYGTGVRALIHQQDKDEIPLKSCHLKPVYQAAMSDFNSTSTTLEKSSETSSSSTQSTAFDNLERNVNNDLLHSPLHENALSVLNMHKKLADSTNEGRLYKKRGLNTLNDNLGLLSLADIWHSGQLTQSPSKLSQKVQEEKLRRQHCEQLIQELQTRNLELQQKIAVALKVDDSKNRTIQHFQEAFNSVSGELQKLKEDKVSWEREVAKIKRQYSIELDSAKQKVDYYEKEASKSLLFARNNQEKISVLEKKCTELQSELEQMELKFKELDNCYRNEVDKNRQLAEIISQKEIELKENKIVLNNAREEVSHSRKAVEVCQAEFTALKNESSRLQIELKDSQSTILSLNEQKRKLLEDIQVYKKNEKTLKEALESSKQKLDNTKSELRNFYQGQLEIIVENKRKEMQSQLDRERQNNLEEIKRKELSVAKTAANHIKEISEKCALEGKLLEQKRQEEVRLYEVRLAQKDKELEQLRNKLAHLPEKRAEIAKQLQKVMENQWNEALKVIGSSSTPNINEEQLACSNNPTLDSELRKNQKIIENGYDDSPVSSRVSRQPESEIQKYINMLLNRSPGNPTEEVKTGQNQHRSTWHPGDVAENQNRNEKKNALGKPPWK